MDNRHLHSWPVWYSLKLYQLWSSTVICIELPPQHSMFVIPILGSEDPWVIEDPPGGKSSGNTAWCNKNYQFGLVPVSSYNSVILSSGVRSSNNEVHVKICLVILLKLCRMNQHVQDFRRKRYLGFQVSKLILVDVGIVGKSFGFRIIGRD